MMSSLALLVSLILFSSPVLPQSVAPDDADPYCSDRPTRQSTLPNEKILMDTQDYRSTRLLGPTGANVTWLTIDYDGGGSSRMPLVAFLDTWFDVNQSPNCFHTIVVCSQSGFQSNWLIMQYINISEPGVQRLKINVTFQSNRNCRNQCDQQTFELWTYQTDEPDEVNRGNISYYTYAQVRLIHTASEGFTIDPKEFDVSSSGLYLAILDQGSCTVINRTVVFYNVCPYQVLNKAVYPETLAPQRVTDGDREVSATCIDNASPLSPDSINLKCRFTGLWTTSASCNCNPGYEPINATHCEACPQGSYKSSQGDEACRECPINSNTTKLASTSCPCLTGYSRREIDDNCTTSVVRCILQEPLKVTPFHPSNNPNASYNFHGICEHILAKPCDDTSYVIVGDFLTQNLTMGRVGIQTFDGYYIIGEDLNVHSSDPPPSSVTKRVETVGGTVNEVVLAFNTDTAVITRTANYVNITIKSGNICGLCGDLDGTLTSSNGQVLNDIMNQTRVNVFASSWQRPPYDQILRDDRRECAVIRNDTVIGDPLFEAALWVHNSTSKYSLCYEIHGSAGEHFNLLSDLCISVNAHYSPMRNPKQGNIINAIGIRASDEDDRCHTIDIVQDQSTGHCRTIINNGSMLQVGDTFNMEGVRVMQRMATRVRIGVPNCERVPLIMWVTCQNISRELMMRFDISRAVNLRPSSHGLLGQFYNIRIQAEHFTDESITSTLDPNYFDVSNLWVISLTPPSGAMRSFIAELYERTWDNTRSQCLYAGNSQGGRSIEFAANYTDSVIEGHYTHYRVDSRFDANFRYKKFDESRCN